MRPALSDDDAAGGARAASVLLLLVALLALSMHGRSTVRVHAAVAPGIPHAALSQYQHSGRVESLTKFDLLIAEPELAMP
jgi:hypothetical protein